MRTLDERVGLLEQAVALLEGKPAKPASPPSQPEAVVTVITGRAAEGRGEFVMPNAAELQHLYNIVIDHFSQLRPREPMNPRWADDDRREHFESFVRAFQALGDQARADAPDSTRAATYWLDLANERLRSAGIGQVQTVSAFTAAALAHGDICYLPLDNFPYDLAFGLRHGFGFGRTGSDAWRRVLSTRQPPNPVAIRKRAVLPPVAIGGGGRGVGR